jgi:glycosyltransferase involved in cell wall biosynthesis
LPAAPTVQPPGDKCVCHINLARSFRGGERQTELLARGLAARGWKQRLVVPRGSPLAGRCRDLERLEIAEIASNPVAAAVAGRRAALVHAHEERAAHAAWLLKRCAGTPYVVTRRVHHAGRASPGRTLAWRGADRFVAVSGFIRESVATDYPDLAIEVVHDAHAGFVAGTARKAFAMAGKTIVGHVGALVDAQKGQGSIIAAARALEARRPELHFVLVGDGADAERLRREAQGLGNLTFTGFVNNVADYLASFDLFVYPSVREGLGSTLLDAMAFGLPIIASRAGGIPEIVEDGVNGLLIPPEDPDALVSALERLLDDPAQRASMQSANRAAAARYGSDRMTDAYESIYRSILG